MDGARHPRTTARRFWCEPEAVQRAKRSLGQNFLVDINVQRRIIEALGAEGTDEVLEIGPGRGALTRHLAGRVQRLVLVELDNELAAGLSRRYGDVPGVDVVHADILTVPIAGITDRPGRLLVVGNIPYNLTTPIIFSLLRMPRPRSMVLMVQREVADRITAEPGGKTYGALSVGVQTVADAHRLFGVGRHAFRPAPAVESAVLRIDPRVPPPLSPADERAVRSLTRAAFSRRRKQLQRTLRDAYRLSSDQAVETCGTLGVDPRARPETLPPERFVTLARLLVEHDDSR